MVAEKNAPEVNETEDASTPQTPPTEPAAQQQLENSSNDLENEKPVAQGPRIRMRQKTPICAPKIDNSTPITVGDPAAALQRTMEALYEASPDMEDNNEEIRKLDTQLDKLNDYMDRVEERLKEHNTRLTQMLKEQKEEREKRRQSFHERMQANRQEDDNFSQQLAELLNRVDMSRRRATVIEHGTES